MQPWAHQAAVHSISKDEKAFAYFMEQRTGKSKVFIDCVAHNHAVGRIEAAIILAPNGVHIDWATQQLRDHWPKANGTPVIAVWRRKLSVTDRAALYDDGSPWRCRFLVMNTEALSLSKTAREELRLFMLRYRTIMGVDEASQIGNMASQRTKNAIKLGKGAAMRRILTGTPTAKSPLSLFALFEFLEEGLLGYGSMYTFKNRYADILPATHPLVRHAAANSPAGRRVAPQIIARDERGKPLYKNLDELQRLIAPHCFRITRAECGDMPEKVYTTRTVELTDQQQALYAATRRGILRDLDDGEVAVDNALTKLLRLQQITGGNLGGGEGVVGTIPIDNNRLTAMLTDIAEIDGKIIIWARFRPELQSIAAALRDAYGAAAVGEHHGGIISAVRETVKHDFQDPDNEMRFFVAQQASGGYGLKLTQANDVLYYSNTFSLEQRLQSEDRPIALDKKVAVSYVDYCAADTVDTHIINALRNKKEISDVLLDNGGLRQWLTQSR